jgi:hypothetical protein
LPNASMTRPDEAKATAPNVPDEEMTLVSNGPTTRGTAVITEDNNVIPWLGVFLFVLVCLYVWTDCVLRNYFNHKRRHHLKVLREIGKERPQWRD